MYIVVFRGIMHEPCTVRTASIRSFQVSLSRGGTQIAVHINLSLATATAGGHGCGMGGGTGVLAQGAGEG